MGSDLPSDGDKRPDAPRAPGDQVDRYVVVSLLGRGGMGEVYEAEDPRLERRVALKLLRSDDGSTEGAARMLREARVLAQFSHPNAVVVYECDRLAGTGETFIAMELVRGRTLRSVMSEGPVDLELARSWLADVARALAAAHRAGIVHRDVKPDNVMLRDDGVIKVLDFGIAKRTIGSVDPSAPTQSDGVVTLTERGMIVGTPHYASPEQLRGEPLDGKTDQFSWGALAYELLTGKHPFGDGEAIAVLSRILSTSPKPASEVRPAVPLDLSEAIARALSQNAADRFDDMDQLADAIAVKRADVSSIVPRAAVDADANPARIRGAARRAGRVLVWVAAAIGFAVLGLIAFGAATGTLVYNVGGKKPPPTPTRATPQRLTCAPAEGPDLGALADAVGVGACMRLASSIGVPWSRDPGGLAVHVHAEGERPVRVVLRADDVETTGTGDSYVAAIRFAVAEAEKQLPAREITAADEAKWGGGTPEATRAVERAWRLASTRETREADLVELQKLAPTSPWPPLLMIFVVPVGSEAWTRAVASAKANASHVAPPYEKIVLGVTMAQEVGGVPAEGLRLVRRASAEAPEDADVAGLYGAFAIAMGSQDEGFAQVDRVAREQPAFALVALRNTLTAPHARDDARNERYLQRLGSILPEDLVSPLALRHALEIRDFDRARRILVDGKRYFGSVFSASAEAELSLASLATDAARDVARGAMGDADAAVRARAGQLLVASYVLDGHSREAEATIENEIERLHDSQLDVHADFMAIIGARFARRLGHPMPDAVARRLREATTAGRLARGNRVLAAVELALSTRPDRATAANALSDIERASLGEERSKVEDDSIRLLLLPLVRAARGDAAAVDAWQGHEMADDGVRALVALDAALAMRAARKTTPLRILGVLRRASGLPNLVNAPLDWLLARRIALDVGSELGRGDDSEAAGALFVGAELASARADLERVAPRFDEAYRRLMLPLPTGP